MKHSLIDGEMEGEKQTDKGKNGQCRVEGKGMFSDNVD